MFFCGLWFYRSGGYRRHEEGVVHDRVADTVFPIQLENIHPLTDKWERSVLEFLDSTVVDQTLLVTVSRVEIGPNNQDRYWGTLTTRAGMDIWLLLVKNGYARSEG